MLVQHHINALSPGQWFRCSSVDISNGYLSFDRDPERKYELSEAYRYKPHLRFLHVDTRDELASFVRTYGPLQWPAKQFVGFYWGFQSWLKAFVRLVVAFKRSKGAQDVLSGALHRFLIADEHEWLLSGLAESAQATLSKTLSVLYSLPPDPAERKS